MLYAQSQQQQQHQHHTIHAWEKIIRHNQIRNGWIDINSSKKIILLFNVLINTRHKKRKETSRDGTTAAKQHVKGRWNELGLCFLILS